ncbi:DUF6503 family protein [Olleya sp. HaHaR_3_96]|uniref:DUF6503 family protein n=1 Tax=Olleya sp. HaHaR_3_96 TaxID=2745560 RepID=UPI001C4F8481|nr:DUF6503 family protein [Olleya sp. HaHaR_3_96]QXP59723.1 hypothetical protein H0I26_17715 [Olleya sp. HaHaR_3_96]
MKHLFYTLSLALILFSCKTETKPEVKTEAKVEADTTKKMVAVKTKMYPEKLTKVFDAHGGVALWKSMKSLEFTQDKPDGKEVTITDLNNRKALLKSENYAIGFDGQKPWFLNKTGKEFKGYDPKFGYNLMFYFYTMPFILSDDGIKFSDAESLTFEGGTYPGIKISYDNGVGATPEDIYILYYNPETFKMEWLGYTVNFVPGIDTKELHFRRYSDWQEVNGLILPKTITGYGFKDDKPTTPKAPNTFTDVKITKTAPEAAQFVKPEKATFVE